MKHTQSNERNIYVSWRKQFNKSRNNFSESEINSEITKLCKKLDRARYGNNF